MLPHCRRSSPVKTFSFAVRMDAERVRSSEFWERLDYICSAHQLTAEFSCHNVYLHSIEILFFQLWPLFGGTLTKPDGKHLFYVPQVRVAIHVLSSEFTETCTNFLNFVL